MNNSGYTLLPPSTLLSPTPVALVSCASPQAPEKPDMVTAAWVGTVNSEPPMVSVSLRKNRLSHGLITASGEFVVNLPDEKMARALDFCGVRSGRDIDKAKETGLEYMAADRLDTAPAVAGAPLSLCCKVRQTLELGSHDMFIGEIVSVMVRDDLMDKDGKLRLEKAGLIAYSHGLYQKLGDVIGFFGWSIAREDVFERRMKDYY